MTARLPGDDGLWTSPMGLFEETLPAHVVRVPFGARAADGRRIDVAGSAVPVSTASGWVEAIYRARPEVGCVIHTHAPHIGAVATTGEVVGLYNNRSVIFWGDQAFYDDDGTHTDSPERVLEAIGDRSILIMRNHGAAIAAPSVPIATAMAVLLEAGARFHVLARSIGGKPFPDNEAFAERARPHRENLALVWDAHLRRLRATDPELFE